MRERAHRWARPGFVGVLLVVAALAGGCGNGADGAKDRGAEAAKSDSSSPPQLRLLEVGRFDTPVDAIAVPDTDLVAVVEQGGRVIVAEGMVCHAVDSCRSKPVTDGRVVLDVGDEASVGGEQGLLGLAFHPDWPDDPRIFIDYTDTNGDTRVEAWTLSSPSAAATREQVLLQVPQPFDNHNGGHLAFGPDGLLYVGTGDGGSGGDPADVAQKEDELLGKLLRIDVDGGGERGYAIPKGNVDARSPVWAVGLRNPWRFSFDSKSGDLWIGDVGQNEREEVDALDRGSLDGKTPNFGWRLREGFSAFDGTGTKGGGRRVQPVLDYPRSDGCSVTGGVVYRGSLLPALDGWYVFADYCQDDLRLVRAAGLPGTEQQRGDVAWTSRPGAGRVVSFGEAQGGELLVVSNDGPIRQVVPR